MLTIALAVAGVAAVVLGLFGSPGLTVVGVIWLVVAALGRRHAQRIKALGVERVGLEQISAATVLRGATPFLVGGVAGLAVGIGRWGIDEPGLRWLPVVVGAVLTVFAIVMVGLFLVASGLDAAGGAAPTVPATITIVSASDTGTFINERPRLALVLDVTPDGQPAYRVTRKATVPVSALGSIRPGDGFRAMVVGPDDPERMDIDWSSPILGG